MYKETRNYENINKANYKGVGRYGIPKIMPTKYSECEFVGFNYAKTLKNTENRGIHFFVDDYQFNRVWAKIDKYIPLFQRFSCVMTPDFSMYTDFPLALQIYNHYRKHWLGAYMQQCNINVIPTIGWSTKESYEWCFDGEPINSIVAVSSVGTQSSKKARKLFVAGYEEMMRRLEPDTVLFYGNIPEGCEGNIIPIKAFQERYKSRG